MAACFWIKFLGWQRMENKKTAILISILIIFMVIQGCAYTRVQRPLDMNFDETVLGSKIGRSHSHSVLWLVAWGDAGTRAAAEQGEITVINHADMAVTVVLFGLYTRVSTIVYGD